MITKINITQDITLKYLFLGQSIYYIWWLAYILPSKYISYKIKSYKYKLWKKLLFAHSYPKDINYYYRLYYATNTLTYYYSIKKQRKLFRVRNFNHLKFHTTWQYRRFITTFFHYNFFYHRVLLNKFIKKKLTIFSYYKHVYIKKMLKIYRQQHKKLKKFYKHKFLRLFNRVRIKKPETVFHTIKGHLLKIFKQTRETHWVVSSKKTLNKRTYCNFLDIFIKKQTFLIKLGLILILQQIRLTKSWKHSIIFIDLLFFNKNSSFIHLKKGSILQFPKGQMLYYYKKLNKKKANKRLWEQRKRQYLFVQSKKALWMKKKKNLYKKIEFNFSKISYLQNYYHYDIFTNTLCILQNINWHLFLFKIQQFSFLLKLTKWRFKA